VSPRPASGRSAIALPLLATVVSMAAFQVGAAVAKGLFPAIGSEGAATLRLCLGAAMLMVVIRPWRAWPRPAPLPPLLGLGVSMAGAVLFFYMAVGRLPLGIAIALQFLGPLGVAVFGSRRPSDLVWAVLAGAGVWSLVGVDRTAAALDPLGIVFALAAAASWAGYILCGRAASSAFGTSTAALAVTIAALIVLPVGVHRAGADLFDPALLPIALLVALLSTVIPFSLEMYALPRLPARTFATFTSLEPVFGVLSGLFILGERLTAIQVGGVALVIAAATGASWSSAGRRNAAPSPAEAPPT
jgi:inner membrane transporter RhtA